MNGSPPPLCVIIIADTDCGRDKAEHVHYTPSHIHDEWFAPPLFVIIKADTDCGRDQAEHVHYTTNHIHEEWFAPSPVLYN